MPAVTRGALLTDGAPDLATGLPPGDAAVLQAAGWTPENGLRSLLNFSGELPRSSCCFLRDRHPRMTSGPFLCITESEASSEVSAMLKLARVGQASAALQIWLVLFCCGSIACFLYVSARCGHVCTMSSCSIQRADQCNSFCAREVASGFSSSLVCALFSCNTPSSMHFLSRCIVCCPSR